MQYLPSRLHRGFHYIHYNCQRIMVHQRIGILHPGQMGIVVAASAQNSGNEVFWASEGRSAATRERALKAQLQDAGTLANLCELCPVIVSVCPPEFAEGIADQVAQQRFTGLYVDANAISPQRVLRIARCLEERGASFVDGGIIGPPARVRNRTWLYLSGEDAAQAASYFSGGPIETQVLDGGVGKASALKMCFAAYSKGSIALLCSVLATARELGVIQDLQWQWARNGPALDQVGRQIAEAAPKAWRFAAEMEEIANTLECAGIPGGFHVAAAEVFRRLAGFKGREAPDLAAVLAELSLPAHDRLRS
jgi:3-hydroxyisobutyrate dehydrogenase-like beta-hydroxyacid dehydrogenase